MKTRTLISIAEWGSIVAVAALAYLAFTALAGCWKPTFNVYLGGPRRDGPETTLLETGKDDETPGQQENDNRNGSGWGFGDPARDGLD